MNLTRYDKIILCTIAVLFVLAFYVADWVMPPVTEYDPQIISTNSVKEVHTKKAKSQVYHGVAFLSYQVEPTPLATPEPLSDAEIALAKTVWGESRGCTKTEQAAVVWCILNRVDSPDFPDDIVSVITQRDQFHGYATWYPVEEDILAVVQDVLARWEMEKAGGEDVGRVLPSDYFWFHGDGKHNYFRDGYRGMYNVWDWSLESPYG